jgi:small nuclear ribonucleoprotein (snRNP)-like protein
MSLQQAQIKRTPGDFFKQVFGRLVTVKLHNNLEYIGILAALDGNLNIVLEQWYQNVDNSAKNTKRELSAINMVKYYYAETTFYTLARSSRSLNNEC